MRDIKFKGWHAGQKKMFSAEEMAHDQMTLLPTGQFINVHGQDVKLSTIYSSDKFIPLQFTGLKDKNGKEIYEGDIVKILVNRETLNRFCKMIAGQIFKIDWDENNLSWQCGTHYEGLSLAHCREGQCEVIGNIYENPELSERTT